MQFLIYTPLIFYFGAMFGFGLRHYFLNEKFTGGTILVHKNEGKIVYSLELDDDPEKLQFKKYVSFKIIPSDESLDRE